MQEWWAELTTVTQFFYGLASFFSIFFLWQLAAAFLGLSGDDVDLDAGDMALDADAPDDFDFDDVIESSQAFKLLSLRSIIAFFTLFSWGSALYLTEGKELSTAMGIASLWGLVGMVSIACIFYAMGRLAETGTKDVKTCRGKVAAVYLNIPASGEGEIKLEIAGMVSHVKAKGVDGAEFLAGTQVRVARVISQTLVEVEALDNKGESV